MMSRAKKVLLIIVRILIPVLISLIAFLMYWIPVAPFYTGKTADFYSSKVFPTLSLPSDSVSNVFFFSLTEFFVVVGSISVIILFIAFIITLVGKIRRRKEKKWQVLKFLYDCLLLIMILATLAFSLYQVNHGFNYRRTSVVDKLNLDPDERPVTDLYLVQNWAYTGMMSARLALGEDYNGVSHMTTDFAKSAYHANELLDKASLLYNLDLSPNIIRAKPVMLSYYWSYTDIVGFYNGIFGEANINVDSTLPLTLPLTICHEIAHGKGYASESDANFIATIACCMSSRPDFRYAGYHEIFRSVTAILDNEQDFAGQSDYLRVQRDELADYLHWSHFHESELGRTISDVSEATNDAFLKANGEEDGTASYNVDSNYYVEFYFKYYAGDLEW